MKSRVKFTVSSEYFNSFCEEARRSGRSNSSLLRAILHRSTKGFTDFSILDEADFTGMTTEPRYDSIETFIDTDHAEALNTELEKRLIDSKSSLIYMLVYAATGFNDYSIVDANSSAAAIA